MATHDYVIANGSGGAVRSDLNNALAAIVSNNSSATEPTTTYAYMWWADTTSGQLKLRNGADSAWVVIRELDGTMLMESGTAGAPGLAFAADSNLDTGIYRPGENQLAISTGGTGRLFINNTGLVGIGTSNPSNSLHVLNSTADVILKVESGDSISRIELKDSVASNYISTVGTNLDFAINGVAAAMRITSAGNVGIGTTSPLKELQVGDFSGTNEILIGAGTAGNSNVVFGDGSTGNASYRGSIQYAHSDDSLSFSTAAAERARIDSSGRLLVGTNISTDTQNYLGNSYGGPSIQQHGTAQREAALAVYNWGNSVASPAALVLNKSLGNAVGTRGALTNTNQDIGVITFTGDDGTTFLPAATILAETDGTPGTDQMPGRIVFMTNSGDSEANPVERMRITSDAEVLIGTTDPIQPTTSTQNGVEINADAKRIKGSRDGGAPLTLQRTSSDGDLVEFYQDTSLEGSISVSGSTVSLNGAHLSRWSQLPGGAERTEILRGTVLSNIDEMCEWGDEDNEQLNRMKVSDVEGDKNVSGVFQAWDDDDDIYTNDFHCAMTGDFVIRIAQGVTVERGDLLMSAGDGTAKAQDDDIIRSKTIAKVTSTHVSETYADGSYCVPCVLMAC